MKGPLLLQNLPLHSYVYSKIRYYNLFLFFNRSIFVKEKVLFSHLSKESCRQKHVWLTFIIWAVHRLRGGIKKNKLFFFLRKPLKGGRGGLAQSKISLSEKNEIFLDIFFKRGGGLT